MRTRRALYSWSSSASPTGLSVSTCLNRPEKQRQAKRARVTTTPADQCDSSTEVDTHQPSGLLSLPDDLLLSIFVALSSCASCRPLDLLSAMSTCKRLQRVVSHPLVLARASSSALTVTAASWCEGSHAYLRRCAEAGNVEACYTVGMIRFYCLEDRGGGAEMLARAAAACHPGALHALAVLHFNGSGAQKRQRDLLAGVRLCARAAALGHVDAMRELGHCLQDGYGVARSVAQGRRLILEANAREAAAALAKSSGNSREALAYLAQQLNKLPLQLLRLQVGGSSLLSDFGLDVPPRAPHAAHLFLVDWFAARPPACGLRLCSHAACGRPETRPHEFRRCSACGRAIYCSRACQALDWKRRHKHGCVAVAAAAEVAVGWQQPVNLGQLAIHGS